MGGSAAGPQQAAATAAAAGGAAADAAAREQANKKKKKKKKSGRPGVVEQLKAKASVEGAVNGGVGAKGGDSAAGKGGEDADPTPPEMGLLDAVAAMVLGEILLGFTFGLSHPRIVIPA